MLVPVAMLVVGLMAGHLPAHLISIQFQRALVADQWLKIRV